MITKRDKKTISHLFTSEIVASLKNKTGWSTSQISHYKNGTKVVSPERAIIIERLVGIPAESLRPDIFVRKRV